MEKIKTLQKHVDVAFYGINIYCFVIQLLYYIFNLAKLGNNDSIIPLEYGIGMTHAILTIIFSSVLIYFIIKKDLNLRLRQMFIILSTVNILFFNLLLITVDYSKLINNNITSNLYSPISVLSTSVIAIVVVLISLLLLRAKNKLLRIGFFSAASFVAIVSMLSTIFYFGGENTYGGSPWLLLWSVGFKIIAVAFAIFSFILEYNEKEETKEEIEETK